MKMTKRQRDQLEDLAWAAKAKELGLTADRAKAQARVEAHRNAEIIARTTERLFPPKKADFTDVFISMFSTAMSRQIDKFMFDRLKNSVANGDVKIQRPNMIRNYDDAVSYVGPGFDDHADALRYALATYAPPRRDQTGVVKISTC